MAEKIIKWNNKLLTFNKKIIRTIDVYTPPAYPVDGLVERWSFNNTLTGINGISWTLNEGTTTYGSGGPSSKASLSFDGATTFICSNSSLMSAFSGTHAWTISFWSNISYSSYTTILTSTPLSGSEVFLCIFGEGNSRACVQKELYGQFADSVYTTNDLFGSLNHFAVTFNGTTGQTYLNGSTNGSSGTLSRSITSTGFMLGNRPSLNRYCNGHLSLFYVYDRALSGTEISQLYGGGSGV